MNSAQTSLQTSPPEATCFGVTKRARAFAALLLLLLLPVAAPVQAQTDPALREQRNAAQKQRQEARTERNQTLSEATKIFREQAKARESDYQIRLKELDTAFELRKVGLEAEQQVRVVGAEAEFQKKWTALLMQPDAPSDQWQRIEQQMKALSAELFTIRKDAAEIAHRERMAVETQKHELLAEMDQRILDDAQALGLTEPPAPIVATPIGGELTKPEAQWNERDVKEVDNLEKNNRKLLAKYLTGTRVRDWERENQEIDFKLAWDEKSELNEIASRKTHFSSMMTQAQGQPPDQQDFMNQMAELAQEERLVKIKYDQIRKENVIKRREERKVLLEPPD